MNNFTLKVLYFSKTKVSVPYLTLSVFHGSSIPASCGAQVGENAPLRSKAKKKNLMHTPQTFFSFLIFLITTLYIGKVTQGNSSLKMQGRETLAPNAVKLGKMQRNDASV